MLRTRGHSHDAVTRLVSPSDIGHLIKPFAFLDYFEADPANAPNFGFPPHSGIATLTLILSGQAFYKETTDREGVIWIASHQGTVATPPQVSAGEAVVFEEAEKPIEFEAVTDTGFVLGSAVKHPHDLVTGYYSVQTTADALRRGRKQHRGHWPTFAQSGRSWSNGQDLGSTLGGRRP